MNRRKFIVNGCTACLGLIGLGMLAESCSQKLLAQPVETEVKDGMIKIPLADLGDNDHMVVHSKAMAKDILLVKRKEGYKALYMECTHFNVGLTVAGNKLICNAHGSQFDMDGNVLQEPAQRNLKEFKTELKNSAIIIHLI